ncbi:MAG: glycerol-3-phosphate 1-O-acyltransferase PlsY [Deltaproteobacteria bacterium]|nr:glycerol-3-phosphate 1-O-acyltransferase PlsY [Deltaproteobacteria bacterium]
MLTFPALALAAYLLGSVPAGLVVARLFHGPDPRTAGSGNPGAANLFRLLGPRAGALTLAGDALKGALPALLAWHWLAPLGPWREAAVSAVAAAAVLGHIYPVYFKFQGGKGVATAFGVVAALAPWAALNLVVVYLAALAQTRVFSAAALMCAWLLPVAVGLFSDSKAFLLLAGVLSGLILVRHRENLERLLQGAEPRI